MTTIAPIAKAVFAAVFTGIGSGLITLASILTGDQGLGDLTTAQWILVVIAVLGLGGGAGTGVYKIPNRPSGGG